MQTHSKEKRDPIKCDPLPMPGDSLGKQIDQVVDDNGVVWIVWALFGVLFVAAEWLEWIFDYHPHPLVLTVFAFIAVGIAAHKIRGVRRVIKQLKLGLRGEQSVGQLLQEALIPLDYKVFHDISEDGYNIDHALIGPDGVFAIETKTISKRDGNPRVSYDGQHVLVDGHAPDRNPVAQVRANADRLRKVLREYSGKDVAVRGVVLYPGWYVEKQPHGVETWVLNDKALIGWLAHESERLDAETIGVLSDALARYVRDQNVRGAK